ncbi:MAG: hypothetical protein QNJ97_04930 [Myxococcota bacterium]|nr:hypothetical protein [Myxococcota bacterium]
MQQRLFMLVLIQVYSEGYRFGIPPLKKGVRGILSPHNAKEYDEIPPAPFAKGGVTQLTRQNAFDKALVCFVFLMCLACQRDRDTDPEKQPGQSRHQRAGDERTTATASDQADAVPSHPSVSLAQGRITAFGLELPLGMTPIPGPDKVFRFESTYHVAHLTDEIQRQVSVSRVIPEENGTLMRNAKVRRPKGNASGEDRIAVRIQKRQNGGSLLDIWLERPLPSSRARRNTSFAAGGMPRQSARRPTQMGRAETKRRTTARREALRVMKKVQNREHLDEKDMASDFFH